MGVVATALYQSALNKQWYLDDPHHAANKKVGGISLLLYLVKLFLHRAWEGWNVAQASHEYETDILHKYKYLYSPPSSQ
jgi:hypothetical protein